MRKMLFFLSALAPMALADVTVTQEQGRVQITVGGVPFTQYRYGDAPHVYYWPVIGPGGERLTRSYPMEKVAGEDTDHPHHRSFWFSHGDVNGVDFWSERPTAGKIEHDAILKAEGGKTSGVLVASQRWVAPDGSVPLRSVQTLRVHETVPSERMVDFEVELIAGEKDVTFGDTKEGTAAVRIAESMRVKRGSEGKGTMINSQGVMGAELWGKRAKWVTMSGPVEKKHFTITFMDHPSNLRHPTRWHARDYGLFAANPFCEHEMDKSQAKGSGAHTLKAGQKLTLKYRILFAEIGATQPDPEMRWKEWAAGK